MTEELQCELLVAEQRREVLERLERQSRVVVVAEVDVAEHQSHHVVLEHVTQPLPERGVGVIDRESGGEEAGEEDGYYREWRSRCLLPKTGLVGWCHEGNIERSR